MPAPKPHEPSYLRSVERQVKKKPAASGGMSKKDKALAERRRMAQLRQEAAELGCDPDDLI